MLHEFLTTNRQVLVERCRLRAADRLAPKVTDAELMHGIPAFLDQLIKTLLVEQSSEPLRSRKVSGPAGGGPAVSEIGTTAALHGRELSLQGFTVEQVVHDYGDLCQAITDLAFELSAPIEIDEFRTLNRCLDNGIADAVTEYALQRNSLVDNTGVKALNERLGFLAHELRNHIHVATLAVTAIKAGKVGMTGATGAVLDRALIGMRSLIDRSLADVRVAAGLLPRRQPLSLVDFVSEVTLSASLEAHSRGCLFAAGVVDPTLALDVDREMLLSAVGNLLQNGFKFTQPGTEVRLSAYAAADRILIEVSDHCGGLPVGFDNVFPSFKQHDRDRSGLGLGLSICRHSIEANNGVLRVRDIAALGCVFTIDLPRHTVSEQSRAPRIRA